VFGSHLSEHTVLVGAVRDQLLRYGIELFVAHDTIEHDKLWQDEIEKALDRAHAGLGSTSIRLPGRVPTFCPHLPIKLCV
jgi:hypothetical protein